jgi:hypothetical protein
MKQNREKRAKEGVFPPASRATAFGVWLFRAAASVSVFLITAVAWGIMRDHMDVHPYVVWGTWTVGGALAITIWPRKLKR